GGFVPVSAVRPVHAVPAVRAVAGRRHPAGRGALTGGRGDHPGHTKGTGARRCLRVDGLRSRSPRRSRLALDRQDPDDRVCSDTPHGPPWHIATEWTRPVLPQVLASPRYGGTLGQTGR